MKRLILVVVLIATACTGWCAAAEASAETSEAVELSETEVAIRAAAAKAAAEAAKEAAEKVAQEMADEAKARAEAKEEAKEAKAEAKEARAEAEAKAKEAREEEKAARRQMDARLFKLSHVSAEEVAENFNSMWSGEFGETWKLTKMAVAFKESNSILVTAPRVILEACERVIEQLDVEAPQVYIEARFVELGNSASHKIGIDWSMLNGMTGAATLGGGVQNYQVGDGVQSFTRTISTKEGTTSYQITGTGDNSGSVWTDRGNGSISYFNGTLNFSQMALTLKALDATEDAKTFSNPKIIVSSGKKAVVDMTRKYPNVNIAAKKTINNNNESVDLDMKMSAIPGEDKFMFAKEAFFSWGIELEVTPRIGTNGLINVSIVPTISQCNDFVTAGTSSDSSEDSASYSSKYPVIDVKRLITEFNLESGTTAVIGGLSVTDEEQVDNGIPLLRDIPWLGPRLFGSMERVKTQNEIVVFVTVGLIDPHNIEMDAGLPKNAVLGRQYTEGLKLEPGDRPARNMEGFDSLDMRPLEEQAQDPLRHNEPKWSLKKLNPFGEGEKK